MAWCMYMHWPCIDQFIGEAVEGTNIGLPNGDDHW